VQAAVDDTTSMRIAIAALSLLLAGCALTSTTEPFRPSIQISIPDAPGWSYERRDNALLEEFENELANRRDTSGGVIASTAFEKTRDHRIILTLHGDHPDQILTITMPLIKASHLPAGTTVTKFTGGRGQIQERVAL
jgi:hypothetical protein